jgi:hypothetical protein
MTTPRSEISMSLERGGVRLFDNLGSAGTQLECVRVIQSPTVTHVTYRILK